MFHKKLNSDSYKRFKSAYFSYHHKDQLVKINRNYNSKAVTRQFKRGLYEVFLQKFHLKTCDGNNPKFQVVRDFAILDQGNPRVFYRYNNVILTPSEEEMEHPVLPMSKHSLDDMMKYGLFDFELMGQGFYIEIFPILSNVYGRSFLQQQANTFLIKAKGNEAIYEFNDISQIDIFMQRWNS